MKFGPKEIKELNEYLRTGRNRKREFLGGNITFASDLTQPEPKREIVEIDAFNQFNLRNPRADGGRASFEPGGPVRKQELIKVLSDAGVKLNPTNFSKSAKELGIQLDTENPLHRTTQPVYVEPTKKELKKIKIKQDERNLKNFASGEGKKAYALREKRMIELLKKGELTLQEIDNAIRKEFGKSSMTTILKLKKDLDVEIPSGIIKGIKNPKTKEIINDLLILKDNKKLNDIFLKKDFNLIRDLPELQNVASKALKNSKASPIRRVGQLLLAYGGGDPELQKYIGKVDDNLIKASSFVKGRLNKSDRLLATLEKLAAEKTAAMELGKPPAFFGNVRKRINEIINDFKRGLNIQVDEIKAIGGAKAKTPAYNLFVQGIKDTVNQEKGKTLDRLTQTAELDLQNAKTQKERIKIKDEYNKQVREFVNNANKNLKPGQLPIRALEISFDKPSKTIQNKQAYKQYKNMFDDIYSKHGYSFKVPKDVMTGEQAKSFLKTKEGQNLLTRQTDLGSQRLFANPFFSPGILKEAFKQLPTPAGAVALNLGLGVDPTSAIDRASIAAEAAFAPALVKQAAKLGPTGQRVANLFLSPKMAMRAARIASPIGIASLGAEGLYQAGKFTKKRIDELRSMTPEQRAELRNQGARQAFDPFMAAKGGRAGFESGTIPGGYTDDAYAYLREIDDEIFNAYKKYKAGGGHLKYGPYAYNAKRAMFGAFGIGVPKAYQRKAEGGIIGDKSGPPPERGPLPQGLPGLLKRGMKI